MAEGGVDPGWDARPSWLTTKLNNQKHLSGGMRMRCRNSDAFASWKLVAAWLSNAPLQASAAPGRGGIAGVLRADGSPAFLYGEITGYWLRWASFYAPNRARMTTALAFITDQWSGDEPAATRLGAAADWRNRGVFSFDLAMMLRGIADARPVVGDAASTEAAATLQPWLERLTDAAGGLRPCLAWPGATLPPSWSTRPGASPGDAAPSDIPLHRRSWHHGTWTRRRRVMRAT